MERVEDGDEGEEVYDLSLKSLLKIFRYNSIDGPVCLN